MRTIDIYLCVLMEYLCIKLHYLTNEKKTAHKKRRTTKTSASWLNLRLIFIIQLIWIRHQCSHAWHIRVQLHQFVIYQLINIAIEITETVDFQYRNPIFNELNWCGVMSIKFRFGNEKLIYLNPEINEIDATVGSVLNPLWLKTDEEKKHIQKMRRNEKLWIKN